MLSKVKIVLKTFGDHPSDTPPGVPVRAFLETFRWGGKSQPEYMQWHLVGWTKGENKTAFISPCILTVDAMWLTTSCPSAMPSLPWWTVSPQTVNPSYPLSLPSPSFLLSVFVTATEEGTPTMTEFTFQAEMTGSYWMTAGYMAHH